MEKKRLVPSRSLSSLYHLKKKDNFSPEPIRNTLDGIDDNYLLGERKYIKYYKENYICCICQKLLYDPVELLYCQHSFCRYCIDKWFLTGNKFCPLCKEKTEKYIKSKSTYKALGLLKIKCTNSGCYETPLYPDFIQHLEKCSKRLYHCKNKNCNYKDYYTQISLHSSKCIYRDINCYYCSKKLIAKDEKSHLDESCPEIAVYCEYCGSKMKRRKYLSNHYSEKNENIECLKKQLKNKENEIDSLKNSHKIEVENLQKSFNYKESLYKKEIENLRNEPNKKRTTLNFLNDPYENFGLCHEKRIEKKDDYLKENLKINDYLNSYKKIKPSCGTIKRVGSKSDLLNSEKRTRNKELNLELNTQTFYKRHYDTNTYSGSRYLNERKEK